MNYPGVLPLDAQLYQRAVREGKGTGGIETIQEQISYFESLTQEEELKMFQDTIEFMEDANTQEKSIVGEFIQYYTHGDVDAFGELMVKYIKEDESSKEFMKKILYDRNAIMAERIYKKLQNYPERSYFFAIGAGHYWGAMGVQNLLSDKGITVIRVNN